MKLMVTTPDIDNTDYGFEFVNWIRKSSEDCPFKVHIFVESPEDADAILFINRGGNYSELLRNNSLLRRYFHKSFVYETSDNPIDFMRGIYVSMPKSRVNTKRHLAYSYLTPINEFIEHYSTTFHQKPDLLFSFMGAATSPIRKTLFRQQLFVGRTDTFIENTSSWSNWDSSSSVRTERTKHYAEILARSKFVLCPRGVGTTTYRLFETMQMGRVPIIIADEWVQPKGPEWSLFSIQVPENKIAQIPDLLREYHERYEDMGKKAREAWEEWFSPNVQFHRLAENVLYLMNIDSSSNSLEIYKWPFIVFYWKTRRSIRSSMREIALVFFRIFNINPYLAIPPESGNANSRQKDINEEK